MVALNTQCAYMSFHRVDLWLFGRDLDYIAFAKYLDHLHKYVHGPPLVSQIIASL